jgi:HD-like signal output (HDOD) protein
MAIIPGPNQLNIDTLNRQLHRELKPVSDNDLRGIFKEYKPDLIPALGEAFGFETIIDDALLELDLVYFASGTPNELIRVSGNDFQLLHSNAWYGNTFSQVASIDTASKDNLESSKSDQTVASATEIDSNALKAKISKITHLPPMPAMAQQIIQLNTNPYAHAKDLAELVEKDPSLSAQIIRYAQSPFYGYSGQITSIRQAISRVLGYDLVMNIALGIAATRPFKNSAHGPLGINAYWRHSTYSASLAQSLCNQMPNRIRPGSGTAYLCGLLHNFGFLLVGNLFPKEFAVLNDCVKNDLKTPVIEHERRLFGTDHTEIGNWLMETWNMPHEVIVSIGEHHNPHYSGTHSEYAHLILLSDILLKSHELGDASTTELPASILQTLGLTEDQAIKSLEKTIEGREDLDAMANQLAA